MKSYLTLKYELILQEAINKQQLRQIKEKEKQMEYIFIGFIILGLITPYAALKAYDIYKTKKNKEWSDEPVDNWKYPSNYM